MSEEDETPSPGSYLLVVLGGCGYACLLFAWFSLPAHLGPVAADLDLSETAAGLLVGAIPLTYVPLSLWSGLAVDRVGPERAIRVGLAVIGVAHLVRGVAAGFPSMLAATVALGAGGTAITFGLPKLVSRRFPPRRLGTMSTVYLLGSYAGSAAAFGLGRPVLGPALGGWRPLFRWTGAGVLGFAAVWWLATRIVPPARVDDADGRERTFTPGSIRTDVLAVVSNRDLRLLIVIGTVYLLLSHGLQGWLPTVLEGRGVPPGTAAAVTTGLVAGQAGGAVAVPPLSDRFGARRAALVACGLLCTAGTFALLLPAGVGVAAAAAVTAGVGLGGLAPLIRALPTELPGIGSALTATAVGIVFAVGEIGGFLGPTLVGALHDATGSYAPGLAALTAGAVLAVVAAAAMRDVDG